MIDASVGGQKRNVANGRPSMTSDVPNRRIFRARDGELRVSTIAASTLSIEDCMLGI